MPARTPAPMLPTRSMPFISLCSRLGWAHHQPERWAACESQHLRAAEAEPLIQGGVAIAGGLQVGRQPFLVAAIERRTHQPASQSLALRLGRDAYVREVV